MATTRSCGVGKDHRISRKKKKNQCSFTATNNTFITAFSSITTFCRGGDVTLLMRSGKDDLTMGMPSQGTPSQGTSGQDILFGFFFAFFLRLGPTIQTRLVEISLHSPGCPWTHNLPALFTSRALKLQLVASCPTLASVLALCPEGQSKHCCPLVPPYLHPSSTLTWITPVT